MSQLFVVKPDRMPVPASMSDKDYFALRARRAMTEHDDVYICHDPLGCELIARNSPYTQALLGRALSREDLAAAVERLSGVPTVSVCRVDWTQGENSSSTPSSAARAAYLIRNYTGF